MAERVRVYSSHADATPRAALGIAYKRLSSTRELLEKVRAHLPESQNPTLEHDEITGDYSVRDSLYSVLSSLAFSEDSLLKAMNALEGPGK